MDLYSTSLSFWNSEIQNITNIIDLVSSDCSRFGLCSCCGMCGRFHEPQLKDLLSTGAVGFGGSVQRQKFKDRLTETLCNLDIARY